MSFPGLLDVIGLFADEELAGTDEDKFKAVGLDFATILASSFCYSTLCAIFLGQLIKLEFPAQIPPDVDFESSRSPANQNLETILICIVVLCYPQNNNA